MRVVVADDAAVMRALVARAVRAAGHEVVAESADLDAAVEALATESPDALILDGRLPGSLPDMLARLLAACETTAIFVLATLDERETLRLAVAAGARGALLRPLKPRALAEALARLEPAP